MPPIRRAFGWPSTWLGASICRSWRAPARSTTIAPRKPLADVLRCIRHKTLLDRAGTELELNAEAELKSGAQLGRLFPNEPQWLRRSLQIAERASFTLGELRYRFPCELGRGGLDPDALLRQRTAEGARWRYPEGVPHKVRAQLDKELGLIAQLAVAPYFLSVQEIVDIARSRSILCQGRAAPPTARCASCSGSPRWIRHEARSCSSASCRPSDTSLPTSTSTSSTSDVKR